MLAEIARLEGIMLLLVLCGALLQKKQVITPEGQSCLTDLLMDVILPSNIFLSLPKEMDWATMKNFLVAIVLSVAVMLGSTALGLLCYGRCQEREKKVFRYGLINSNALFIGLPVVQSLLGAPGVAQLNMYMLFVRLYCWSYGLSLYTGVKSDWRSSIRRLLLHPCMIATGLGLLVMVTEWPVPAVLTETAEYFSSCLMALSMLLIGAVLSHIRWREFFRPDVWGFTLLRLGVLPGAVLLACVLFRVPYVVTATCTLLSGMPAASLTAVLAARYRGDEELGSALVAISTVLSAITITLWFFALEALERTAIL